MPPSLGNSGRLTLASVPRCLGQRAVASTGGTIAALGLGAPHPFLSLPDTILGFAAAGFRLVTLVPAARHEAEEISDLRAGTGVTVVSWLMRLGFLLSPPIVVLLRTILVFEPGSLPHDRPRLRTEPHIQLEPLERQR